MKKLVKQIIGDFKIDTGESLASEVDNIAILLRDGNAVFPCIQVEYNNRTKQYRITKDIALEIRAGKYIVGIVSDRPYNAVYVDTYWFLLDNK